jgi:acyl-CoA synthetase (AMP-forming)/AMP-acid ligase II
MHHIQLTSGSTGTPKGAVLTHRTVATNIDAVVAAMQGSPLTDAGACWLPMYHDMGLMQLLMAIYQRPEMILQSSSSFLRNPMRWLERIHEHRVTMAAAPAFAFTYCVRRYRSDVAERLDLSCWRVAGVGAERVEHRVLREFHARFGPHGFPSNSFRNCYGMAEAGFAVAMPVNPRSVQDDSEPVPSVGVPVAGMEFQVRDTDGRELADGEEGELFMRGSSLMSGYFGDRAATADEFDGGWFRTGDLGYRRNGELYILGRRKELVILGGRNYHPQVFEQCVAGDPDVGMHRSVALGVYREFSGTESLVLLVEPRIVRGLAALRTRLQARLRGQFGFGAAEILFLQSGGIPRTTSHKAQRDASRLLYETGRLRSLTEREPAVPAAVAQPAAAPRHNKQFFSTINDVGT